MKIAVKITLLTFIFIIAVSAAISSFVYYFQAKALEAESRVDIARLAERSFDRVNMFLYERIGDIKTIATATRLTEEGYSRSQITARLIELRDFSKCYDSLAIFNLNRICIADTAGINIGRQHSLNEYWLDPFVAKDVVVYPAYSETVHAPVIYFSYPVRNTEKKVFRTMVSRVPLSKIGDILKIPPRYYFEKRLEVDLIDSNGILIYSNHSLKGILKRKTHYWNAVESRLKTQAQPAAFFFQERGETPGKDLVFILPQPGYLDYQGQGWYLMFHMPLKEVLAPVVRLRNDLFVITLIFVLMACITAFIFSRKFSGQIKKLHLASERFRKGDMDYRVSIKSGDEIEEFAGSFNKMAEDLKESKDGLEAYSNSLEADIAERKKLEGELKKAVEDWDRTFNSISDPVLIVDKGSIIIKANMAFAESLNIKPEDLLGKKSCEILHRSNPSWPDCPFEMAQKDKLPHIQKILNSSIGVPLLVTASPILDDQGEVTGGVLYVKDVSRMKEDIEKFIK